MVHERDCRLATRGRLDSSQADSVAHCSRRKATGGIKTNFKWENRERSAPSGMNNAMIDKNNQLLERDNKQGTGEENSNVSAAEDPSRLVHAEVRQGSLLGSEHICFVLPSHPAFRRLGYGVLEATEVTEAPHGVLGRIKRFLIGPPIPTARADHERLTKFKALAVLSSDAISSVAYATEAILLTLVAGGSGNLGLGLTLPISFVIIALLG